MRYLRTPSNFRTLRTNWNQYIPTEPLSHHYRPEPLSFSPVVETPIVGGEVVETPIFLDAGLSHAFDAGLSHDGIFDASNAVVSDVINVEAPWEFFEVRESIEEVQRDHKELIDFTRTVNSSISPLWRNNCINK